MALEIKRFDSKAVLWGGYDPDKRLLVLCFTSNKNMEYDYPNVPESIWRGLVLAPSQGRYYNDHIRDIYGVHRKARRSLRQWP